MILNDDLKRLVTIELLSTHTHTYVSNLFNRKLVNKKIFLTEI